MIKKYFKSMTLIELLVILSIVSIVISLFIPGCRKVQGLNSSQISPFRDRNPAAAQALQEQNTLKEREIEIMKENNRLMREILEKNNK